MPASVTTIEGLMLPVGRNPSVLIQEGSLFYGREIVAVQSISADGS
jgi:hypothetical protein